MRTVILSTLLLLMLVPLTSAQDDAADVKAAMEKITVAWDARDVEALKVLFHDPTVMCFAPAQVADLAGLIEIAEGRPPEAGAETLGEYEPEVIGNVSLCIAPNTLAANEAEGREAFDKVKIAAVLLKTGDAWQSVAAANIWEPEAMAEWVGEQQGAQVKALQQMATTAWEDAGEKFKAAAPEGTIDWAKFGDLCHDQCVLMGPMGPGGSMSAALMKPLLEAGNLPPITIAPTDEPETLTEAGLGVVVTAYNADATAGGEVTRCRMVDVRVFLPMENAWKYVLFAGIPVEQ